MAHFEYCLHAFAMGSNAAQRMLIGGLAAAPTTLIAPTFDPAAFAAAIEAHRVGSVFVVPAMATALVKAEVWRHHDLSSVVLFGSTAAALPPDTSLSLAECMPMAVMVNTYTSTEASPAELIMTFDPGRPTAVGRPDRPDQLRVTDACGRPAPTGTVGDIWLRSNAPPRSYLDQSVATDGWIPMGDVGRVDQDGYLHVLDRADDLISQGGRLVSTVRIEAALQAHPRVAEAAVVGRPHPVLGQVPVAAIVLIGGGDRVPADLFGFLGARLDRHELPADVRVVTTLSRTATGKVIKSTVRDRLARPSDTPRAGPGGGTVEHLAGLWAQVLDGVNPQGSDDFFGLGGDSLSAARLAQLIAARFDVEVAGDFAFDHRSLAEQAARLTVGFSASPPTAAGPASTGVPVEFEHELSSLQEHLLAWMHETNPARDVGPICVAIRVTDDLNVDLLGRCLAELVGRHDALRTRYHRKGPQWTAVVRPELAPEVVFRAADPRAAGRVFQHEIGRPFDWRDGPLVRLVVVRVADREHLLALVIHHLAVDGWSFGILLRELGELSRPVAAVRHRRCQARYRRRRSSATNVHAGRPSGPGGRRT